MKILSTIAVAVSMFVATAAAAVTPEQLVTHQQDKLNASIALQYEYQSQRAVMDNLKHAWYHQEVIPAHNYKNKWYGECAIASQNVKPWEALLPFECKRFLNGQKMVWEAENKFNAIVENIRVIDVHLGNLSVNIPAQRLELAEALRKAGR